MFVRGSAILDIDYRQPFTALCRRRVSCLKPKKAPIPCADPFFPPNPLSKSFNDVNYYYGISLHRIYIEYVNENALHLQSKLFQIVRRVIFLIVAYYLRESLLFEKKRALPSNVNHSGKLNDLIGKPHILPSRQCVFGTGISTIHADLFYSVLSGHRRQPLNLITFFSGLKHSSTLSRIDWIARPVFIFTIDFPSSELSPRQSK